MILNAKVGALPTRDLRNERIAALPTPDHMPFSGHRTCAEWGPGATVRLNLADAPSGMETRTAEWARKAAAR